MKKGWITKDKGYLENLPDLQHQIQNKQILKIFKTNYQTKRQLNVNIVIQLGILIQNVQKKTIKEHPQCQNGSYKQHVEDARRDDI